jgi:hypothetical protein
MNPILYTIPLTNTPQTFQIELAGITYTLTVKWNDMGQSWMLDIADSNNNYIVSGIPLVTGNDLLSGLAYLGIGGSLYVLTNSGSYPAAVPTLDNLGTDVQLCFYTSNPNE